MTSGPRRKYYYCQTHRRYIYSQSTKGNHRRDGCILVRLDIDVDENKKFVGLPSFHEMDLKLMNHVRRD